VTEPLDETTRLDQLRQGHEPAFRWLVETYQERVFRTALAIVQTDEEAEDVAQEVFMEVYQTVGRFRGEASLATWLYRLTTSRALKKERDRKRRKRFGFMTSLFGQNTDNDKPDYDPPDFQTPGTLLETDEQIRQISRAVASLADSQRVAFTLFYQEELSYQSINRNQQSLLRTYYQNSGDSTQTYREQSSGNSNNMNHRLNFRLDYAFDKRNSLLITPRLSFQTNTSTSLTNSDTRLGDALLNQSDNTYSARNQGYTFNNSLLFRHRFEKRARTLSLNVGTALNDRTGLSTLLSENDFFGAIPTQQRIDQRTNTTSNGYRITDDKRLRFTYRTSTDAPTINQLQNVLNNTNPLVQTIGNPDLKQSYTHALSLRFTKTSIQKASSLVGLLAVNLVQNPIGSSLFIAGRAGVVPGVTSRRVHRFSCNRVRSLRAQSTPKTR